MLRKVHHVRCNGFRHGRTVWSLHGFGTFLVPIPRFQLLKLAYFQHLCLCTNLVLFLLQMSYDTPFGSPLQGANGQPAVTSLPLRQQLKIGFKDMGTRSWSMAKNFGKVGGLFSGIECGIEGLRAKNDLVNGMAAGCLTGGILAKNAGPQAMVGGCAAFAAFSAAIDAYMRQPSDE